MTGCFNRQEIEYIEALPVDQLAHMIINSDPVVALRALTELLAHENWRLRLRELLLRDKTVQERWHDYEAARGLTSADRSYAGKLLSIEYWM